MNVAVYSGSFNPLHIGHLAILKHLLDMAGFDMVYLIVSPKNPLKNSVSSDSGHERYKAAVEAVNRHFRTSSPQSAALGVTKGKVDDIELTMPEPHYTIRTLDALKAREPENCFTLVMGADNLADIRRWKDYKRILSDFGVAAFPREGYDLTKTLQDLQLEDSSHKILILDAEMVDVSSTQIRDALANGECITHLLM